MSVDTATMARAYPKHNVAHPFDPLTYDELETTVCIVHGRPHFRNGMRFVMLQAKEPTKAFIGTFRSGQSFERLADALLIDTGLFIEPLSRSHKDTGSPNVAALFMGACVLGINLVFLFGGADP